MIPLEVISPLLTASGSLVLAWRVKALLDSLVMAQTAAELNAIRISEFLTNKIMHLPIITGTDTHVRRSQKFGIWLLVLGFLLIGGGALLNAYIAWVGRS